MRLTTCDSNKGLQIVPEDIRNDLIAKLEEIEIEENKIEGKYIRIQILKALVEIGWSDRIAVIPDSRISITAVNRNIGLCVQFGNMARFYADLLKLQALYEQRKIDAAMYVIPTKILAKRLLANTVNFERMVQELSYYCGAIKIPIVIIGIEEVVKNGK